MSEKKARDVTEKGERFSEINRDHYAEFQEREGIPVHKGFFFPDLNALELGRWGRMGGSGAYINLHGEEISGDNYICEIPPGQTLTPQRHMYEELVYVLSGRGATTIWVRDGGPKWTFEWKEQSLFALPSNIGYQHFNGDDTRPARLFGKTTLPAVFQYFRDPKFIFQNDFVFEGVGKESYSGEAKTYQGKEHDRRVAWVANFVPDVKGFDKLSDNASRGAGGRSVFFFPPGLVRLHSHMSEFPVGTYKPAHAHPPGRSILPISGKGYSILWKPGQEHDKKKIDWKPGSLFGVGLSSLQGECWWHQHFNSGAEPARYLVLHVKSPMFGDKHTQIEYVDEEPEIRNVFEKELATSGLTTGMPPECYTNPNYKFKKST